MSGEIEYSKPVLRNRVTTLIVDRVANDANPRCLDIGSGTGSLLSDIATHLPGASTSACDYTDELMQRPGQAVEIADLNHDTLPYADNSFDVVTCTEVVEHLENYRHLIREVFRVTSTGGHVIFSTPNVLNLQSRLRFLTFGFWNLFGPLPVNREESYSTVGHITPVPSFYLSHALAEAGFKGIDIIIDKHQKSSLVLMPFTWPFIKVFGWLARRKEVGKYQTIDESNVDFVEAMNSFDVLTGRTIILVASKPHH